MGRHFNWTKEQEPKVKLQIEVTVTKDLFKQAIKELMQEGAAPSRTQIINRVRDNLRKTIKEKQTIFSQNESSADFILQQLFLRKFPEHPEAKKKKNDP